VDELTDVATPTWGSSIQDKLALRNSRALDGSPQALAYSDTHPQRLQLMFNNLPNDKFDALRAFFREHLNPPAPFTYTDPITLDVLTLAIEVGSRPVYTFAGPNKNSTSVVVWTI
jgi:hypothetical protein